LGKRIFKGATLYNLAELRKYGLKVRTGSAKVLVLEMEEFESDPTPGCIPTMVALSHRHNWDQIKQLSKRMGNHAAGDWSTHPC
jgi:hypothetical protein